MTTQTQTITIHYLLSDAGRREALKRGLPAQAMQQVVVDPPPAVESQVWDRAVELSDVSSDGKASVVIGHKRGMNSDHRCWSTYAVSCVVPARYPTQAEDGPEIVESREKQFDAPQDAAALLAWEARRRVDVERVLTLREASQKARESKEKADREARDRASAQEWASLPLEWRAKADGVATCVPWSNDEKAPRYEGPLQTSGSTLYNREVLERYVPGALAEARAEVKRLQGEEERKRNEAEARRMAERGTWIRQYGSPRLQRCLEEGIEVGAAYRDERLALERPGWRWEEKVYGAKSEPRNPPAEAFQLLDEARATDPDAKLYHWAVEHDREECQKDSGEPCDCPKYVWTGYVAMSSFLGKAVIFGGPEIEVED